jgi:hypothetical protein
MFCRRSSDEKSVTQKVEKKRREEGERDEQGMKRCWGWHGKSGWERRRVELYGAASKPEVAVIGSNNLLRECIQCACVCVLCWNLLDAGTGTSHTNC